MSVLKLVLLVAAIPLGMVGLIRLMWGALRYYRRNRAEAGVLSLSLLRDHFAEGVERWADAPSVAVGDGFGDGESQDEHSSHGHSPSHSGDEHSP